MPLSLRSHLVAGLVCVALVSACSTEEIVTEPRPPGIVETGPVLPIVQSTTATPGAILDVVFRNTSSDAFWFNPCERDVQRREGDAWVTLPDELRVCNSMAYVMEANAERTEGVDVPLDVGPGEYRFVFTMRAPQTPDVAHRPASTSFVVR